MSLPAFLAVGSVLIDDIVYPDGRTRMGTLGGGGTHAAYGMALAGEKPGLVALVGQGLPAEARARLEADFDCGGLQWTPHPQLRGWQIFEWNGLRREIFRVERVEPFLFEPDAGSPAIPYAAARGLTLLRGARHVPGWRRRFPDALLLWEPMRAFMLGACHSAFSGALPHVDIVSPNLHEARAMYGDKPDERELLRAMLEDGAGIVALRMGARGSLVAQRGQGLAYAVPAVPVDEVVDQTGAGNSYCGGFLLGWYRARNLAEAACMGAAAASFTLEAVGCPRLPAQREALWRERVAAARRGLRTVRL